VRSTLGDRWRSYKYSLRNAYFYHNKTKEEILAKPPSGVGPVEWTAFVHHYKSDKMKVHILYRNLFYKYYFRIYKDTKMPL